MSTADRFARYGGNAAENYQRYFVPVISAPLASELLELAALRPGERVLDAACGTGHVARLARERVGPGGAVTGLDVNPGMLAVAKASTPPELEIAWQQASIEAMPLADQSFDVALCQLGLQFPSDRARAVRELRRVLAPGGRAIASVVGPMPPLFLAFAHALSRHVSPQSGAFVETVFGLHDRDTLHALFAGAGFAQVAVRGRSVMLELPPAADFLWQYVQSTPLSAQLAQVDADHRAALERDAIAAWQPFATQAGLACPLELVLVTAQV